MEEPTDTAADDLPYPAQTYRVALSPDPGHGCEAEPCGQPAVVMVEVVEGHSENVFWRCLTHWTTLRAVLAGRGHRLEYTAGASVLAGELDLGAAVTLQESEQHQTDARSVEPLLAAFEHLRATATAELNRHLGEHGRCLVCDAAWPCERAVLAAFALEVV